MDRTTNKFSFAVPFIYGAGSWVLLAGSWQIINKFLAKDIFIELAFLGLVVLPILVSFFMDIFVAVIYSFGGLLTAPFFMGATSPEMFFVYAIFCFYVSVISLNIPYFIGIKCIEVDIELQRG